MPTTWDGFVLQYNRLLQQRAEAFAADWVLEEFLDEGGFAKVYRGSHRRGVGGGAGGFFRASGERVAGG